MANPSLPKGFHCFDYTDHRSVNIITVLITPIYCCLSAYSGSPHNAQYSSSSMVASYPVYSLLVATRLLVTVCVSEWCLADHLTVKSLMLVFANMCTASYSAKLQNLHSTLWPLHCMITAMLCSQLAQARPTMPCIRLVMDLLLPITQSLDLLVHYYNEQEGRLACCNCACCVHTYMYNHFHCFDYIINSLSVIIMASLNLGILKA